MCGWLVDIDVAGPADGNGEHPPEANNKRRRTNDEEEKEEPKANE
jgi:hypothetical protein